jgi:hypothetical protein
MVLVRQYICWVEGPLYKVWNPLYSIKILKLIFASKLRNFYDNFVCLYSTLQ